MKIISGAVRRDAGEIRIDGRPVEIRNPLHARSLGIGIIYQELNLVPQLTIAENIFLGREPRHFGGVIDQARLNRDARQFLADLGLTIDATTKVSRLSVA